MSAIVTHAQVETATISGTVSDESGAVIPQASLTLTNVETGATAAASTSIDGLYVFYAVHPGPYRIAVTKNGFKQIALTDLTVNVQDVLSRNFTMQVGGISEYVTLSGETVNLGTQRAAVSTLVDQQFVGNMPLNGRSFQSLIQLTPGTVVVPTDPLAPGQFSVNGQRSNSNYTMVDGASANFGMTPFSRIGQTLGGTNLAGTIQGGTNGLVSVDAMQEFRIQTSTFAPEFGRTPGAQLSIVTKAGTNQFHGTLYDYLRNEAFDARNYFNRPPEAKPPLRQNDFGGTIGGPIIRNSTFFFFSYEGLRLEQPNTATSYFYTESARASVAPPYRPLVNAFPIPDGPLQNPACDNVRTMCLAQLTASYSNPSSFDAYSLRLDHTFSKRLTMFGRYSYAPSTDAVRSFQEVVTNSTDNQTATVGATVIINPTMVNDVRVNWSRSVAGSRTFLDDFHGAAVPPDSALFRAGTNAFSAQTNINFVGAGLLQVGTTSSNVQRQMNIVDSLSFVAGTHRFKLGMDFRRVQPTNTGLNNPVGTLVFLNNLLLGTVSFGSPTASEPITVKVDNYSFFVQDTWKVARRLTLNYGVRWDIDTPPSSTADSTPLYPMQGIFDSRPLGLGPAGAAIYHTKYTGFAPRVGAAYQLTSTTVIRGGFGLFYDLGYPMLLGQMTAAFPYTRQSVNPGAGALYDPNVAAFAPPPFTTTLSSSSIGPTAIDPNLDLPMVYQWNGTVQHDFGGTQSLTVSYVGAHGERLLRDGVIVPPGGPTTIGVGLNGGFSHFNALEVQFQRRMNRGFQALASYTLAKSSDVGSNDYSFIDLFTSSNVADLPLPPLSRSDFDIRNTFSTALSYEVPDLRLGGVCRALLSNWALDGVVRVSSGPPLDVRIQTRSTALGNYRTIPNLVAGEPIWLAASGEPGGKILNPAAFTIPTNAYLGNFERNSIQSPFGIAQADIAVRRRFLLTERLAFDFRAELFNVFNHPMFGGPNGPDTFWGNCPTAPCLGKQSSTFGKVNSNATLNQGLGGGGLNGGQSPLYAIGGPRSAQFTLKLSF